MPRYGTGKPDANQAEIVEWLRTIPGVYVVVLSMFPGILDLLVYANGILTWWEIKLPGKRDDLTDKEREIMWATLGATFIVEDIEQARQLLVCKHGLRIDP